MGGNLLTAISGGVTASFFDIGFGRPTRREASGTFTYARDPSTELVTSITDPLNRQTTFIYDGNGNIISVTRLVGTQQAVTTTMTYDPTFNQLTSVTDPPTHEWTLGRDSIGRLTSITDPLSHQIMLGYNSVNQLTSVTGAANDTTSFTYNYGDLAFGYAIESVIGVSDEITKCIFLRKRPAGAIRKAPQRLQ